MHLSIIYLQLDGWMGEHCSALKTSRLLHQRHRYIWGNPPTRTWVTCHLWLMSSINMSWTAILIWVNSIELMDLIATDQTIDTSIGLHKHAGVVCSYCSFQSQPHHHITLVIQTTSGIGEAIALLSENDIQFLISRHILLLYANGS